MVHGATKNFYICVLGIHCHCQDTCWHEILPKNSSPTNFLPFCKKQQILKATAKQKFSMTHTTIHSPRATKHKRLILNAKRTNCHFENF